MYWLLNTIAGLYTVHKYNDYLSDEYPDLSTNIMVFATKWFSAIILTIIILVMLAFGSVMPCFGDLDTLRQYVIGLAFPVYFICVLSMQLCSSGYGTWFFMELYSSEETEEG